MRRFWIPIGLFLAAAVLFIAVNRKAYDAYFSADDLETLTWASHGSGARYALSLLTPEFSKSNFRPAPTLYYLELYRLFKLRYVPYVAVLQALHLLNVVLLFLLLGRLGFPPVAAAAGALFYAFHPAVMAAFWEPRYIFEVVCATFCLLTLILYIRGNWLLGILTFWLAYKSKELAVALPVALAAYEYLAPERHWKRLAPYFLISLNFGLQALWNNTHVDPVNEYALHLGPAAVGRSLLFYLSTMFSRAWLLLLAVPFLVRDWRLYFGLILAIATLMPMLLLPEHLNSVYWYVPMIGVAVALAAVAERLPVWIAAVLLLAWMAGSSVLLRQRGETVVANAQENRHYVAALADFAARTPPVRSVMYSYAPPHADYWFASAAIRLLTGSSVVPIWQSDPRIALLPAAEIVYEPGQRIMRGVVHFRDDYVIFDQDFLGEWFDAGWYEREGSDPASSYRWIKPRAEVTLVRSPNPQEFEIVCMVPAESVKRDGPARVTLLENGVSLGTVVTSGDSVQTLRWPLSDQAPGKKRITILVQPERHFSNDQRSLGIAVRALGYSGAYSGNWTKGEFPESSGGTIEYSDEPGAAAKFWFSGTAIRYMYTKAFNRGKAPRPPPGGEKGVRDSCPPPF